MTDPATVGECDPDREVVVFRTSERVHLPDGDGMCSARATHDIAPRHRKRAAVLFDDTPICRECRGVAKRVRGEGSLATAATTEVRADD